ncbi:Transcriptional regulator, LysR family [Pseudomonas coronafaciens pv. striafaciens]|uniref:Transcriptional regulator, LysR family n=2 Tax=Pseudomonas coronafaciens TaxID=53409 RepID=A0A3M4YCA5_9PSED|nr:Transcriptional regulator, LysR family [Pseudomonas coronafaciens pv. striafaciens]
MLANHHIDALPSTGLLMNELRALSTFVQAATLGSLRKAAIDQGITPQAASQAVMQLEKSLGVRLFHRTTRKLSLTEEGLRFYDAVKPGLAIVTEAFFDVRHSAEEVSGPLRVSAPKALGISTLWPFFAEFSAAYPHVQLDIQFNDHFTDLVSDRADVGFRGGAQPSSGVIARFLMPIQMIVCASPHYIERYGSPSTIDALAEHRCTGFRQANTGQLAPWVFQVGNEVIYREVRATICTNDVDAEVQAVLDGLAIGQLGSFSAVRHLRSGRLVPLLMQHIAEREGVHMYYGHRTELSLRVRTFIDFVVQRVADNQDFYLSAEELTTLRKSRLSGLPFPSN